MNGPLVPRKCARLTFRRNFGLKLVVHVMYYQSLEVTTGLLTNQVLESCERRLSPLAFNKAEAGIALHTAFMAFFNQPSHRYIDHHDTTAVIHD